MSIIQEALKRQEEEGAEPDASQEQPPENPPQEPRSGRGKLTGMLVGVLVLIAAAAGLFILYQMVLVGFLAKDDQAGAAPGADTTVAIETGQAGAESGEGPASGLGRIVSKVEDVLHEVEQNAESVEEPRPLPAEDAGIAKDAAEKNETAPAVVQTTAVQPVEEVVEAAGQSSPSDPSRREDSAAIAEKEAAEDQGQTASAPLPVPKEAVYWPKIHIKGIMAPGSGNRGTVLIEDRMLSDGDSYMGVRILQISRDGVLLEYKNERRVLSTGQAVGN